MSNQVTDLFPEPASSDFKKKLPELLAAKGYEDQALTIIGGMKVTFRARQVDDECPMFCEGGKHIHGQRHRATFARIVKGRVKTLSMFFWNSYADAQKAKLPTAYDVLACLTKNDPGKFEDFCGDYGYEEDSRKAEQTYKAVVKEWKKVEKFFSESEIRLLQEIA
jgi:hypothetical protein